MDCVICPRLIVGMCLGELAHVPCSVPDEMIEENREESEPQVGDVIYTPQGIRVVEAILDDNRVSLRPILMGLDDAYPARRPPRGAAWSLLTRGREQYIKGQRHVR